MFFPRAFWLRANFWEIFKCFLYLCPYQRQGLLKIPDFLPRGELLAKVPDFFNTQEAPRAAHAEAFASCALGLGFGFALFCFRYAFVLVLVSLWFAPGLGD